MNASEMKNATRQIESEELTSRVIPRFGGQFIDLACGRTHYEVSGNGEPVVLVHGYATPFYIYDKVFAELVAAGYRVLRYDLLGRGYSERVKRVYDADLFAEQLFLLTKAVFGESPSSWSARLWAARYVLISTSFTAVQ